MEKNILKEKIARHNEKVDYNRTMLSWVIDGVACLIFFPYIIMVVYRRGKYNEYMKDF